MSPTVSTPKQELETHLTALRQTKAQLEAKKVQLESLVEHPSAGEEPSTSKLEQEIAEVEQENGKLTSQIALLENVPNKS